MNERRRELIRGALGATTALASTGLPAQAAGEGSTENFRFPWNAPENVEAALRRPRPTHLGDPYFRGPALSPDGSLMAVTLPSSPVNEIAIIDLATRTGWFLAHPNYRVKLAQPAFSPDGQSLALVVTPPTYYGVSEIWITSPRGGGARVLAASPASCFMLPSFSHDNSRIVCFAEAEAGDPAEAATWARSYRTGLVHLALNEIDVASRQSTKLAQRAWSTVNFVAYGRGDDGFFLRTGLPSIGEESSDGRMRWSQAVLSSPHQQLDGFAGYFVRRGEEPSRSPQSVIPAGVGERDGAGRRGVALLGVDRRGRLLVRCARANQISAFGSALVLVDGEHVEDVLAPTDAFIQEGALAFDTPVVAGRATWIFDESGSRLRPPDSHTYIVNGADGAHQRFDLPTDISFESSRLLITPLDASEMST